MHSKQSNTNPQNAAGQGRRGRVSDVYMRRTQVSDEEPNDARTHFQGWYNRLSLFLVILGTAACVFKNTPQNTPTKLREHILERWTQQSTQPAFFKTGLYPLVYLKKEGGFPYRRDVVKNEFLSFVNFAPFGYILFERPEASPSTAHDIQRVFKREATALSSPFLMAGEGFELPQTPDHFTYNALVIALRGGLNCLTPHPGAHCLYDDLRLLPRGAPLPSVAHWQTLATEASDTCMPLGSTRGTTLHSYSYGGSTCFLFRSRSDTTHTDSRLFCYSEKTHEFLDPQWDKVGLFFLKNPNTLVAVENTLSPVPLHTLHLEPLMVVPDDLDLLPFGKESHGAPPAFPQASEAGAKEGFPTGPMALYDCQNGTQASQRTWLLSSESDFYGQTTVQADSLFYEVTFSETSMQSKKISWGNLIQKYPQIDKQPSPFCAYMASPDWRCGQRVIKNAMLMGRELADPRSYKIMEPGLRSALADLQLNLLERMKSRLPGWNLAPCAQDLMNFYREDLGQTFVPSRSPLEEGTLQGNHTSTTEEDRDREWTLLKLIGATSCKLLRHQVQGTSR